MNLLLNCQRLTCTTVNCRFHNVQISVPDVSRPYLNTSPQIWNQICLVRLALRIRHSPVRCVQRCRLSHQSKISTPIDTKVCRNSHIPTRTLRPSPFPNCWKSEPANWEFRAQLIKYPNPRHTLRPPSPSKLPKAGIFKPRYASTQLTASQPTPRILHFTTVAAPFKKICSTLPNTPVWYLK